MQPTLCSKCKKNVAVVFISRQNEKGEMVNEGLCLKCAAQLGLPQVEEMMKRMGISPEDLENINNEMMQAFGGAEELSDMPAPQDEDDEDDGESGKTATFPFLNRLFGGSNPPAEKSDAPSGREEAPKGRINPGNIGSAEKVRAVADACRDRGIPIRIGVNGGSLERELLQKYGGVTAQALVDSALGHVRLLNDCNFDDICISVKCSHVPVNMAAYHMLHEQTHYPLHLGVTEAGTPRLGVLKSAIGIGGLLCQGIGDTIRVSLTADPEEEVRAALDILSAAGLRKTGPDLISCPTCGRTRYDMIPIAREVERRLQGCTKPITVAVMGCVVNGPGEARAADVGIAGGDGEGLLFRHGEILRKVPQDKLVDALMDEIDKL